MQAFSPAAVPTADACIIPIITQQETADHIALIGGLEIQEKIAETLVSTGLEGVFSVSANGILPKKF